MAKEIILPFSELKGTLVDTPNEPTLEITENGVYNVKGYTYADVNVEGGGSSDFSTAEVTIVVTENPVVAITLPLKEDVDVIGATVDERHLQGIGSETFHAILYKGKAYGLLVCKEVTNISGDATFNDGELIVEGNCTITVIGYNDN